MNYQGAVSQPFSMAVAPLVSGPAPSVQPSTTITIMLLNYFPF